MSWSSWFRTEEFAWLSVVYCTSFKEEWLSCEEEQRENRNTKRSGSVQGLIVSGWQGKPNTDCENRSREPPRSTTDCLEPILDACSLA